MNCLNKFIDQGLSHAVTSVIDLKIDARNGRTVAAISEIKLALEVSRLGQIDSLQG